jgi:hypothetical protein
MSCNKNASLYFCFFQNINHHSLSPRSTSSSLRIESNSLRPINYSSQNHIANVSTNGDARDEELHGNHVNNMNNLKYNPSSSPRSMNHLSPNQTQSISTPEKPTTSLNMKISMIQKEKSAEPQSPPSSINGIDISESRGREKKRSTIFGTLKKRLSRSRTRKEDKENSMEPDIKPTTSLNTSNYNNSNPSTNRFSGTFSRLGLPTSRKSSFSEASAISNSSRMSSVSKTSTKTFLHEASTLVLEVVENGVTRFVILSLN